MFAMRNFLLLLLAATALGAAAAVSQAQKFTVINFTRTCLSVPTSHPGRQLLYPDKTLHPVRIPYCTWASARVVAQISNILTSEIMGYSTELVDGGFRSSDQVIDAVAGCADLDDVNCLQRNLSNPGVAFTLETGLAGITRVSTLPKEVQPLLLGVAGYEIRYGWYLWRDIAEAGYSAQTPIFLDYYKSYNGTQLDPARFFDSWEAVLASLPAEAVATCSDPQEGGLDWRPERYRQFTNDTAGCQQGDTVWFAPACRGDTARCVPLLLQRRYTDAMLVAFLFNMPLAIIRVRAGHEEAYHAAIRRGRFLFDWQQPDDALVDALGRFPKRLTLPQLEDLPGADGSMLQTDALAAMPHNYAWRRLPSADPYVAHLAARVVLGDADMAALMLRSRRLKDAGAAAHEAEWRVACDWVRAEEPRWRKWIPAVCDAGFIADAALANCTPCPAGAYCAGPFQPPQPCPLDAYCPENASRPTACPAGRHTDGAGGAAAAADCVRCTAGQVPLAGPDGGLCVSTSVFLLAVILPVVFAVGAAAAVAIHVRLAQEEALWKIKSSEVEFVDPPEVLGSGSQGQVVKAFYRGTPVAVKRFRVASGKSHSGSEESTFDLEAQDGAFVSPYSDVIGRRYHGGGLLGAALPGRLTEKALRRRVRRLTGIRHPCVTTVMGVADLDLGQHHAKLCVVMELMEFGSLHDILDNKMFLLNGDTALRFLQNVAQGMQFLHEASPPIIHGDLKSSNVLVDAHLTAKISDFGLQGSAVDAAAAAVPGNDGEDRLARLFWAAPEVLQGQRCNTRACDVYSFGVVVYECLTRRHPYDGEDPSEVLDCVRRGEKLLTLPAECTPELAALMRDSTTFNPFKRPAFGALVRRLGALDPSAITSPAFENPEDSPVNVPSFAKRRSTMKRNQVSPDPLSFIQRNSKSILHDLFPQHVAEALMRGQRVPPEHKEMITMFFCDVVGFTEISSTLPPEKVSDMLDRLFLRFDELADKYGIYKIETIGDAYLCATNVVLNQHNCHAAIMARFSREAIEAASHVLIDESEPTRGYVRIRVGLHSGPCMASVVGLKNPKYTLLGDTINTASRMESTAIPGRIHVTARTAELIRAQDASILLEFRGKIEVKGKGMMETYWITLDDSLDSAGL